MKKAQFLKDFLMAASGFSVPLSGHRLEADRSEFRSLPQTYQLRQLSELFNFLGLHFPLCEYTNNTSVQPTGTPRRFDELMHKSSPLSGELPEGALEVLAVKTLALVVIINFNFSPPFSKRWEREHLVERGKSPGRWFLFIETQLAILSLGDVLGAWH